MPRDKEPPASSPEQTRALAQKLARELVVRRTPLPADSIVVGEELSTRYPVLFRAGELTKHLHVIGGSETGKSRFLQQLARKALALKLAGAPQGLTIIDVHGTLARAIRDYIAVEAPELASEVVFLDLVQAEKVTGYNPLLRDGDPYYVATCIAEGILKACGIANPNDKPGLYETFRALGQALILTGRPFTDGRFFLRPTPQNLRVLQAAVEALPPGDVHDFWSEAHRKFSSKTATAGEAYTWALSKVGQVAEPLPLRRMLGQTQTSIDFQALMDQGGIGLFDLSRKGTGISLEGQRIVAALLCQEYYQELDRREGDDSATPHLLVLDEFGDFATAEFARVLTSGRKFAVQAVFGHQNLSQLVWDNDRSLLDTVLAVPNKVIFGRVPPGEAKILAEDVFFSQLDPMLVKYWSETIHWDPEPRLVTIESETEGTTDGFDATNGPAGESSGYRSGSTYSRTRTPQYVTFYRKRVEREPKEFVKIDEQVLTYAQLLRGQPKQHCVVGRINHPPRQCKVADVPDVEISAGQRRRLMDEVHTKTIYLDPGEVDQLLAEREPRAVGDIAPEIESSSGQSWKPASGTATNHHRGRPPEDK